MSFVFIVSTERQRAVEINKYCVINTPFTLDEKTPLQPQSSCFCPQGESVQSAFDIEQVEADSTQLITNFDFVKRRWLIGQID